MYKSFIEDKRFAQYDESNSLIFDINTDEIIRPVKQPLHFSQEQINQAGKYFYDLAAAYYKKHPEERLIKPKRKKRVSKKETRMQND